tara:strand:+ start:445 stop:1011 length:567 start_codon:yes stop_codon:yes gene_type:complete
MILDNVPSYQEYDQKIIQFQSKIDQHLEEISFLAREREGNNLTAIRRNEPVWGAKQAEVRNDQIFQLRLQIDVLKQSREDYAEAVVQLRRIKDREAIEKEMQIQSKLIEQQVRETFRIQSEQYLTATPANTVNTDSTMRQIASNKPDTSGYIAENPVLNSSQQNSQSPQTQSSGSIMPLVAMIGMMLG